MAKLKAEVSTTVIEQFLFFACDNPDISDQTFTSYEAALQPQFLGEALQDIPTISILHQTPAERDALQQVAVRTMEGSELSLQQKHDFASKIGFSLKELIPQQRRSA